MQLSICFSAYSELGIPADFLLHFSMHNTTHDEAKRKHSFVNKKEKHK